MMLEVEQLDILFHWKGLYIHYSTVASHNSIMIYSWLLTDQLATTPDTFVILQ